ncbi:hypothetical protein [Paraferrimonas haliotis]|uniref:Uncharacterized protein n=1 Tax=Paraferrimonas haliotis TaxID=2013866 RepID=A0AA37TR82_9GAMM|nr:hypothetical protein [Paraferrimonas haliotis]GLS84113.1 hypothetical protein GCM10007894_20900 [Paraferrimonas haliotis]
MFSHRASFLTIALFGLLLSACSSTEPQSGFAKRIHHKLLANESATWHAEQTSHALTAQFENAQKAQYGLSELSLQCHVRDNEQTPQNQLSLVFLGLDPLHAPAAVRLFLDDQPNYLSVDSVFQINTQAIRLQANLSPEQSRALANKDWQRIDAFGGSYATKLSLQQQPLLSQMLAACQMEQEQLNHARSEQPKAKPAYQPRALNPYEVAAMKQQLLFSTDIDLADLFTVPTEQLVTQKYVKVGANQAQFTLSQRLANGALLFRSEAANFNRKAFIIESQQTFDNHASLTEQMRYFKVLGLLDYKTVIGANRQAIHLQDVTAQVMGNQPLTSSETQLAD